MGPWTVTRSSLRMLRRVAAFCRPLRPVLLLVAFPRSRGPVVGVPGLCPPAPHTSLRSAHSAGQFGGPHDLFGKTFFRDLGRLLASQKKSRRLRDRKLPLTIKGASYSSLRHLGPLRPPPPNPHKPPPKSTHHYDIRPWHTEWLVSTAPARAWPTDQHPPPSTTAVQVRNAAVGPWGPGRSPRPPALLLPPCGGGGSGTACPRPPPPRPFASHTTMPCDPPEGRGGGACPGCVVVHGLIGPRGRGTFGWHHRLAKELQPLAKTPSPCRRHRSGTRAQGSEAMQRSALPITHRARATIVPPPGNQTLHRSTAKSSPV